MTIRKFLLWNLKEQLRVKVSYLNVPLKLPGTRLVVRFFELKLENVWATPLKYQKNQVMDRGKRPFLQNRFTAMFVQNMRNDSKINKNSNGIYICIRIMSNFWVILENREILILFFLGNKSALFFVFFALLGRWCLLIVQNDANDDDYLEISYK